LNWIPVYLRDNWKAFETLNVPAGHQPLLDPLMVFGAKDVIFLLPMLLLALWFALARWSPLSRTRQSQAQSTGVEGERARLEYDRKLGQRVALLGCLGVAFALALNVALSHLVFEPRPFVSHPLLVHRLIAHVADNSFPSDHEAVAGAVTTALGLYLLFVITSAFRLGAESKSDVRVSLEVRRLFVPEVAIATSLFLLALAALCWIGLARVYTGVHYPGDIAVGALCGFVGCVFAVALRPLVTPVLDVLVRLAEQFHLA